MSLAFLFHYLMLIMFQMLINPSSGACDLFVELFHGLYCSGTMCVGVTVWFGCGWCGIRMQAEVCIRIPHHCRVKFSCGFYCCHVFRCLSLKMTDNKETRRKGRIINLYIKVHPVG